MKAALKALTFATLLAISSCQHIPRGRAGIWTTEVGGVNLTRQRCSGVCRWIEEKSKTIDPNGVGVVVREGELSRYLFSVPFDLRIDNGTLLQVLARLCETNGLSFSVRGREATICLKSEEIMARLKRCESLRCLAEARVYLYGRELEEVDRFLVLNSIEPADHFLNIPDPAWPYRSEPIYFVYGNMMSTLFPCEDGWHRDRWSYAHSDDISPRGYYYRTSMIVVDYLNLYLGSKYEANSFATEIIKHLEDAVAPDGVH